MPKKATVMRQQPLSLRRKDWAIIGLLGFFICMAYTLELYWVLFSGQLVARADTELLAFLFSIYGDGDSAYYDNVTAFTRGLETINIFLTQPLNAWLIFAILRHKAYRHALQLTLSSYLAYSVILYFWTAHLSGYVGMRTRNFYTFLIFYTPNLSWLLGSLYMAYDSAVTISQHFRGAALD